MPKINPSDLDKALNDTGLSAEEIAQRLEDGVTVTYNGFSTIIERSQYEIFCENFSELNNGLDPVDKIAFFESLIESIESGIKKVLKSKKNNPEIMDNLMLDLCIWNIMKN